MDTNRLMQEGPIAIMDEEGKGEEVPEAETATIRKKKRTSLLSDHPSHQSTFLSMASMNDSVDKMPPIVFSKGLNINPNVIKGGLGGASLLTQRESGMVCRICLEEPEDNEASSNPFITPCKCTGSMKYIHLNCVREWLNSKKQEQTIDGVSSYYWEELSCELCKEPLNLNNDVYIRKNGQMQVTKKSFSLLSYDIPEDSRYLVLESDINCLSKAIHVINFDHKNVYTVGRRIVNDITISDISVSRAQSEIKLNKHGKLIIKDMNSKFGTFVQIKGLYEI